MNPKMINKKGIKHNKMLTTLEPDVKGLSKADNLLRQMRYGLGYDPLSELIELAQTSENESLRFQVAKELMNYVHPKQRSKEVSPDASDVFDIQVVTSSKIFGISE